MLKEFTNQSNPWHQWSLHNKFPKPIFLFPNKPPKAPHLTTTSIIKNKTKQKEKLPKPSPPYPHFHSHTLTQWFSFLLLYIFLFFPFLPTCIGSHWAHQRPSSMPMESSSSRNLPPPHPPRHYRHHYYHQSYRRNCPIMMNMRCHQRNPTRRHRLGIMKSSFISSLYSLSSASLSFTSSPTTLHRMVRKFIFLLYAKLFIFLIIIISLFFFMYF